MSVGLNTPSSTGQPAERSARHTQRAPDSLPRLLTNARWEVMAPNMSRTGRRTSRTAMIPTLEANVSATTYLMSSFIIGELLEQSLEVRDVALAQLAVTAEMRRERRHAPGEESIE